MSFIKKLFGKSASKKKIRTPNKAYSAEFEINQIDRLTDKAVKVSFNISDSHKDNYKFEPGQYLNLIVKINGEKLHRSYSICSDIDEPLAIGVKETEDGYVSKFFNQEAKAGYKITVGTPIGRFTIPNPKGNYVGIAAGSGITPILSIAKMINRTEDASLDLIYGNRDIQSVMFKDELKTLNKEKITTKYVFSEQEVEDHYFGMLSEEMIEKIFSDSPKILSSEGFYICGPEPVIINAKNVLERNGVSPDKIFYELFTTPVEMDSGINSAVESDFSGISQVKVILYGEEEEFELETDGDNILEEAELYGMDAPYSCRTGICRTCKAKLLEGSANMERNYTLSESEVKEGYILTCQAHPTSEKVVVSYDD